MHKNESTLDDIIFCLKCEWATTLKHLCQGHTARNAEVVKFTKAIATIYKGDVAMKARS